MNTLPWSLTNTRHGTGWSVPARSAAPGHRCRPSLPRRAPPSVSLRRIAPRFSIITPVYDPPLGAFLACADSVRAPDVRRLGVVPRRTTAPPARRCVAALADAGRVRSTDPRAPGASSNGGIVAASNDALAMATGEFDRAARPRRRARRRRRCRASSPTLDGPVGDTVDYLYTDEAHVLADGRESAHFLKPDWSPERFRSSMYTCHLSVLRRSLVESIGGFRAGLRRLAGPRPDPPRHRGDRPRAGRRVAAPARCSRTTGATSPARCRGRRDTLSRAIENGRRAVQEQCDRLGIDAEVAHGPVEGCYRVVRDVPADGAGHASWWRRRLRAGDAAAPTGSRSPTRCARWPPGAPSAPPGLRLVVAHPRGRRPGAAGAAGRRSWTACGTRCPCAGDRGRRRARSTARC